MPWANAVVDARASKKIERLKTNKIYYEQLQEKLAESGDTQISVTDADARALLVQGQVVEVAYNVQAAVDAKHNLVVATHTINKNDRNALSAIAKEAKANLEVETYTALVDKGYHNGRQIDQCQQANITTIVAAPTLVNSNEYGTTAAYMVTQFTYNKTTDTYTCPQGETLTTTGTWHKKTRERDSYQFKKYRTPKCKTCAVKHLCTGRQQGGRENELFDLIKQMPLVVEKKIKGKICFIETGNKMDESLVNRVRQLRKQASKIGRELDELFFKTNPEWARFYEYTNKT